MRICFSADLHGNDDQYHALCVAARKEAVDALLIGGDLMPPFSLSDPATYKDFISSCTAHLGDFKRETGIEVGLIMGNDDLKMNEEPFMRAAAEHDLVILTLEPVEMAGALIAGYPYVSLTPFRLKDWEKLDLKHQQELLTHDIILAGFRTTATGKVPFTFDINDRADTIERDLETIAGDVWVVHEPPYLTALDRIRSGHVGSQALREAILEKQPLITLHGHIHETVDVSGQYMQQLGETWCYGVGNYHDEPLAYIIVDTDHPGKGGRKRIKVIGGP
ncbi:hypothetical protein DRQ25_14810 [Candidatus Fermentibacteria bacterium]|nr:MAG: hypothetical protein DRQ25_14810 [Candidatus Fermentibacteria bacterium]